jgi:HEAT repeat protein
MPRPLAEEPGARSLRSALEAFDRARSWEASRAGQEQILALGPEVLPCLVAELSKPQDPERFDILVALLAKLVGAHELMDLAEAPDANPTLRSSVAEALGLCGETWNLSDAGIRSRAVDLLARLAADHHDGVRVEAVASIGRLGIATVPALRTLLARIATGDSNPQVRDEARFVLEGSV